MCDTGGSGGGVGSFLGVAAEKSGDPLILTTQFEAGWYRYTIKWKFYLDGRIQPIIGFGAVNASCIARWAIACVCAPAWVSWMRNTSSHRS